MCKHKELGMELLEGKNNFGASPFFFAIAFGEHGGLEAARALLSAGADINGVDGFNNNALTMCSVNDCECEGVSGLK